MRDFSKKISLSKPAAITEKTDIETVENADKKIVKSQLSIPDKITTVVFYLYAFMLGISLLGASFKLFGSGLAEHIFTATSNPLLGLTIGVMATVMAQSSSTTTALTVGLVGGGVISPANSIPMLLGANIGTTITNTLISIGSIRRRQDFKRAFSAATIHDVFNIMAVVIILPVHLYTNFLSIGAAWMADRFADMGGLKLMSPLSFILTPAETFIVNLTGGSAVTLLVIAAILMFGGLHKLVKTLKSFMLSRVQVFFDEYIFKTAARSFLFGIALTFAVQSSSISTSIIIPLAAAGILRLEQIFPYTLGTNIGTTMTAMLASLATGNPAAVVAAFAHLLFNVCGIIIIYPIRHIPIAIARRLGDMATDNKWLPFAYISLLFVFLPLALYFIL